MSAWPRSVAAWALMAAGVAFAGPQAPRGDNPGRARLQYLQFCVGCHGMDGSGAPGKGVPSMRGALGRFLDLPGGREFIVQVPGIMNSPLNDRDVAELMNWLLPEVSSDTVPATHRPYGADEVARLRASRPTDVPAARRLLVEASRRVHDTPLAP